MAQDGSNDRVTGDDPNERVALASSVVYDDGELIPPEDVDDALREHGVTVTESDDGTQSYEDVPPTLSLSACFLAVDCREDPATFLK